MYGGTKQEMDRLIRDAMKYDKTFKVAVKTTGKGKKANQELAYSYADIVKAIHIVQNEMDITGTTQKEAEKTITGSLNMVKSAWKNLITAMGEGNEDKLDQMIDNLVDSAEKFLDNMVPVAEKAIYGIVHLLEALAPTLADRLPQLLNNILPALTKATATLVTAFAKALIQNAPVIVDAAKEVLKAVFEAVKEEAPGLIPVVLGIGGAKVATKGVGLASNISDILKSLGIVGGGKAAAGAAAGNAISGGAVSGAAAGISAIGVAATAAVGSLIALGTTYAVYDSKFRELAKGEQEESQKAADMYAHLVETKGKQVADKWAEITYGVNTNCETIAGAQAVLTRKVNKLWADTPKNAWDALKAEWNKYFGANGSGILGLLNDAIVNPVKNIATKAWDWGKDLMSNWWDGLKQGWQSVKDWFGGALNWLRDRIHFSQPDAGPLKDFGTYAPDMMKLFAQGIKDNAGLVTNAVDNAFNFGDRITGGIGGQEVVVPRGGGSPRMLTAIFQLNGSEVGRILTPLVEAEQQRVGVKLSPVTGGAY